MNGARPVLHPLEWDETFSGEPNLCSARLPGLNGALLRRWSGTAADMDQPPLDHHYVALHLGGAKRITRRCGRSSTIADAENGSVSLAPAGTDYSWTTQGPIGFAHLYLHPNLVDQVASEEFDRDGRSIDLMECVGQRLPLISALVAGMLEEVESPGFGSRLVLSSLLHSLAVRLLAECSTAARGGAPARHAISPSRLRRVIDFIDANLAVDIELQDLALVARSSRYHFSRAFREATGFPPYRYVIHRRIDAAKTLLLQDTLPIGEIAKRCGFNSRSQFSVMFRRVFGTSPDRFRREH